MKVPSKFPRPPHSLRLFKAYRLEKKIKNRRFSIIQLGGKIYHPGIRRPKYYILAKFVWVRSKTYITSLCTE